MATYKAQFWSHRRYHNEDIYTFVEAFQRLADMAWPFMAHQGGVSGGSILDGDGKP